MTSHVLHLGAIVTRNIAMGIAPILYAERCQPIASEDSGWQFTEGSDDKSNFENAQIWMVHEVIDADNTLEKFVDYPVGTRIVRNSKYDSWRLLDD
jgi:hypothetical protein